MRNQLAKYFMLLYRVVQLFFVCLKMVVDQSFPIRLVVGLDPIMFSHFSYDGVFCVVYILTAIV